MNCDRLNCSWIVCQIGARENYGVARALSRRGALLELITDAWSAAPAPLRRAMGRIGERNHPELYARKVWAPTGRTILREVSARGTGRSGWRDIMERNAWFQRMALRRLAQLRPAGPVTLFAYSYAAAEILAHARERGWPTVLGQIDPGPVEARLVEQLYNQAGQTSLHEPIPAEYWETWRREVDLADVVMVNSDWSKRCLVGEGVDRDRIAVVPLAFEGEGKRVQRQGPKRFDVGRPLRLLFLGQVTLRKGIDIALDALRLRPDAPLELDVIGPLQITVPETALRDPRIRFHGAVPRSAVFGNYAKADVFLFPTRSDGFGLTQLEALSAGVPVIATDRCGAVVEDGRNGIVLTDLRGEGLASILDMLLSDPARVDAMRRAPGPDTRFGIDALGDRLLALGAGELSTLRGAAS